MTRLTNVAYIAVLQHFKSFLGVCVFALMADYENALRQAASEVFQLNMTKTYSDAISIFVSHWKENPDN